MPDPITAPKITVTKAAPDTFMPWAFRATKLRDGVLQFVADLAPEGNPNPAQVERVKHYLLDVINSFPPEVNAVEIMVEGNSNPNAEQTNIIIFPKTL